MSRSLLARLSLWAHANPQAKFLCTIFHVIGNPCGETYKPVSIFSMKWVILKTFASLCASQNIGGDYWWCVHGGWEPEWASTRPCCKGGHVRYGCYWSSVANPKYIPLCAAMLLWLSGKRWRRPYHANILISKRTWQEMGVYFTVIWLVLGFANWKLLRKSDHWALPILSTHVLWLAVPSQLSVCLFVCLLMFNGIYVHQRLELGMNCVLIDVFCLNEIPWCFFAWENLQRIYKI